MPILLSVADALPEHETGWRALWSLYCGTHALASEVTDATWRRILDPTSPMGAVIAVVDGEIAGFIIFVTHECTWEIKPVCYVEDLFVAKQWRGRQYNVAIEMGKVLTQRLQIGEWSRIYGITRADNLLAQRLYASYAKGEPYLRYIVKR